MPFTLYPHKRTIVNTSLPQLVSQYQHFPSFESRSFITYRQLHVSLPEMAEPRELELEADQRCL